MINDEYAPVCLFPQNALLPAGLRQKDQTAKKPTGTFNRDGLLKYLEKEALEYKDREDIVPFTGEKKGVCDSTTAYNKAQESVNKAVLKASHDLKTSLVAA